MSGSVWCVKPESVKIDLTYTAPDGTAHPFWVTLKKRLNNGEDRQLKTSGWRGLRDREDAPQAPQPGADPDVREPELAIDWSQRTISRFEAYIVAWSLTEDDGKPLSCHDRTVLDNLEPDVFNLIDDAIKAHIQAMDQEKKLPSGRSGSFAKSA